MHSNTCSYSRCVSVDLIGEAKERVVVCLRSEPQVEFRGDPYVLAFQVVNMVIDTVNGEHVLTLSQTGWRLEHDLRCRMLTSHRCPVESSVRSWVAEVGRPTEPPGRYVVRIDGKIRGRDSPVMLEGLD